MSAAAAAAAAAATVLTMISSHYFVRYTKGSQKLGGEFVADGGARKQLARIGRVVVAVLRLAEIPETDEGHVAVLGLGILENGQPLAASDFVVFHFARVDV